VQDFTIAALRATRPSARRHHDTRLVFMLGGIGCLCLFAAQALAAGNTYRCIDTDGVSIFTDSPSQLEDCTPVKKGGSSTVPSLPTELSRPDGLETSAQAEPGPPSEPGRSSLNPAQSDPQNVVSQVIVPVHRAGRSLTVRAKLNGTHEARLIVDTGADITILSHKVALDLGITPSASTPTVTLNTVGGSVRADLIRLSTLAVGTAEVRNVSVAVHTLPDAPPEVDGLLGLTFLDKFLVTLDAQKGELHLSKRE
jgi:clan AA aspartic protease (TIGR02281 family)